MGRPPKAAPVFLIILYHKYLWIFLIHSLYIPYIYIYSYIYFLAMFHMFSLVCFLSYGVKSRSGHDRSPIFGPISHVSGTKLSFWSNFIMVLHGFASRSPKNTVLRPKTLKYDQKLKNKTKNLKINPEIFQVNIVEACRVPCGPVEPCVYIESLTLHPSIGLRWARTKMGLWVWPGPQKIFTLRRPFIHSVGN